jgi:hypothetical protein
MKAKDRSFPYPVLSPFRDDVQPNTFAGELAVSVDAQTYHLDFKFNLGNTTLLSLIQSAGASYAVHVECKGNFFRHLYRSTTHKGRVSIPGNELIGNVEVSFFVIAANEMSSYRIEGAHSDYADASFIVRPGDVLAVAPAITFDADKDYDPLKKVSSILIVCPADDVPEGPFTLDFTNQKLCVFLAKRDYERYAEVRNDPRVISILTQTIVLPALAETIYQMRQTPRDEADSGSQPRWFRIIRQRLLELGEDYANTGKTGLDLAQKLLSNPLGRCFKELSTITEGEERP